MPEMHLRQPVHLHLHAVLVDHLQKTKKESKNLKKQESWNIYQKKTR